MQVAQWRGDEGEQLVERRDDRADELSAEHVDRRELRELLDVVARERLALEDATAQRQYVRLLGGRRERFRHGCRVARRLDEGDRGRSLEHDEKRVGSRLLGGATGERVLDDAEARSVRDELIAQRLELLVGQAAVVGDEERVGRAQLGCQLLHDPVLVRFQHVVSS